MGQLRTKAAGLGFGDLRVGPARLPGEVGAAYRAFIDAGHHGTMAWLARAPERRESPDRLWPAARSAITVALSYAPESDPRPELEERGTGYISVYARNRDYHDVIKGRLKELAGWLASRTTAEVKVFVDTAPLLEKPLAAQAGLGWQGKHTNLVSRRLGSWFFIGTILTDLDLPADAPEQDHCGTCARCLDACPTGAFVAPHRLDARRCISYLTIEHDGPIPRALRPLMGNRIYGCDDCLAACPWNRFAVTASEAKLAARDDLTRPTLGDLAGLDDTTFRRRFAGSPIKRIGRDRFVRNVLVAIGNSADPSFVPAILALLDDEAAQVRGAAVWALGRLAPHRHHTTRMASLAAEADAEVRAEWLAEPDATPALARDAEAARG